jgi:hypothetical protein
MDDADDVRKQRRDDVWDNVIGPAIGDAMAAVRALQRDVPRRLRLSTVLASNDPMEVRHGIAVARRYLKAIKNAKADDHLFKATVRSALDSELLDGTEHRLPSPHVCCFSTTGAEEKVEHWALYGRSGSGFGLVFDGPALAARAEGRADLVPVVYQQRQQRQIIGDVIERGRRAALAAAQYAMKRYGDDDLATRSFVVTAHAFGMAASHVAAVAKRSGFRFEQEWRLLAGALPSVKIEGQPKMDFSAEAIGSVIRTFFEFPFEPTDLKAVIVGPVHADLNLTAVKDLIEEREYPNVEVRIGKVALRTLTG